MEKAKKIGAKGPLSRLWIEGKALADAGFAPNAHYTVKYGPQSILLALDPNGPRRVSACAKGAIIDVCDREITEWANGRTLGTIVFAQGVIVFTFSN